MIHSSVKALKRPAIDLVCSKVAKLKLFTMIDRTATMLKPLYAVPRSPPRISFVLPPACMRVFSTSQG